MPADKRAPLEAAEIRAREIGNILKPVMPPGWVFMLVLSSCDDGGFFTYLSNAQRDGAIKLLREAADKIEKGKS